MRYTIRTPQLGLLVILLLQLAWVLPARAHANLQRSEPPPNASLSAAPDSIRLWFTEPLEPAFSRFTLRDSRGEIVPTAASQVADDDPQQLFMPAGDLPDGLYTVVWRSLSRTDGHPAEGSFSFGINVPISDLTASTLVEAPIAAGEALIRALNVLAVSLMIGGLGFRLFVWARMPEPLTQAIPGDAVLRLVWIGWALTGVMLVAVLMMQTSLTAEIPFWGALAHPALIELLARTSFGRLWLARAGLWALVGGLVWAARGRTPRLGFALAVGALLLLPQSLFGHASAAPNSLIAVAANWLHLAATALWVGGLAAFAVILTAGRRSAALTSASAAALVGHFSNYARVAVTALLLTGAYAAWLHVGSVRALLETQYGRVLVVKLCLLAPLLAIAAINLVWTHRRLQADQAIWVGRLRQLIGAEIALLAGVLLAVGALTSGSPARPIQALRAALPPPPLLEMRTASDQMVHLEITPGSVGHNRFAVTLTDANDTPITDISLIRMRFESLEQNLGRSELRPAAQADSPGIYQAEGANLSLPGWWRIRLTIQRPLQFDTVVDFDLNVSPPTALSLAAALQIPTVQRLIASSLLGAALLVTSGVFLALDRSAGLSGGRALALAAAAVGLITLLGST